MPLLAAVGVGVIILGAIVLLLMPNRPGGTISWAGAQVNSAGAGLPLIVVGVAAVAIGVARGGGDDSTTTSATTTTQQSTIFEDSFSTPAERRWYLDSSTGAEADFSDGALHVSLTRGAEKAYVGATPRTASVENVRVSMEAHRVGGTATEGYGYGLFCRSDGAGNLYTFTLWANHAGIAKQSGGQVQDLGTNANVTARGDAVKKLEAVCVMIDGGRAVDLQFLVNGEQVLRKADPDEPLKTGAAGLRAILPKGGGNPGDGLEIEFDNFKVSAQ